MTLCFAYGSNLDLDDLRAWAVAQEREPPTLRPVGHGWLRDRALVATRWSARREGGVLDVVPARGAAVEGWVFDTDDHGVRALDDKEGVDQEAYRRVCLPIQMGHALHDVQVYEVLPARRAGPFAPSPAYAALVAKARSRLGLDDGPDIAHLFVYGTLMPGEALWPRLEALGAVVVGDGTTSGTLCDFGDWPGLVPGDEPGVVQGVVVRLAAPAPDLGVLDELEGYVPHDEPSSLFSRRIVHVRTAGGPVIAWGYVWPKAPAERAIPSGSWRRRVRSP